VFTPKDLQADSFAASAGAAVAGDGPARLIPEIRAMEAAGSKINIEIPISTTLACIKRLLKTWRIPIITILLSELSLVQP